MPQDRHFYARWLKLSSGERFVVLMRSDTGFPVELVARYLATSVMGLESENTTDSRLTAIKAFYEWSLSRPLDAFDPELRLLEPDPLDLPDIKSLALYLRGRRRHKVMLAPRAAGLLEGRREVVALQTVAQYLMYIRDFVTDRYYLYRVYQEGPSEFVISILRNPVNAEGATSLNVQVDMDRAKGTERFEFVAASQS